MNNLGQIIDNNKNIKKELLKGAFGLERENLRVNADSSLSEKFHPKEIGNKYSHPFITTDFGENQLELVTPPMESIKSACDFMETLTDIIYANIGDELLWPNSLPPEESQNVDYKKAKAAYFGEEGKSKEDYRNYLCEKYGVYRMLMCGTHFNVSLSKNLLNVLTNENANKNSNIYLKIVRNFIRHRWFLIWLYGCSPFVYDRNTENECNGGASFRNTKHGYKNKETIYIPYNNIEEYKQQITNLIDSKTLYSESELYSPIRLKFDAQGDISHIEIRIIDLFPYNKNNISSNNLHFTHLFLLFCLFEDEENQTLTELENKLGTINSENAARCGCSEFELETQNLEHVNFKNISNHIINKIKIIAEKYHFTDNTLYTSAIQEAELWLQKPEERTFIKLQNDIKKEGFLNFNINKAIKYKQESIASGYKFHGLEDLELSTQLLLKAAILKGVNFEILDRKENFVRLFNETKEEYVIQATKTSLDNYSSILAMENKVVTKKILAKKGINVPKGEDYNNIEQAKQNYDTYKNKSIVIKPKSTNFGKGITIIKNNNNEALFYKALEIAFSFDITVLIEEFISGKEYRFFVLNNEVVGILHRVPANVEGDGISTIYELVEQKNRNPLRGNNYTTPLEKIKLEENEKMFLEMQNLNESYIPKKNEIVYLRENSNISTGGDSIDFTDDIDESYKKIAIEAAKALNAKITGIDIMIEDIKTVTSNSNYAIIEMNFNPAIHIHCYPFKGKNRQINTKLITALGF